MVQSEQRTAVFPALVVYRDVMVPVRDGTRLATDIYFPSLDGSESANGPFPVLLSRTPYGKRLRTDTVGQLTSRGYAVAIQDKRGRYASEGIYRLLMDDGWGPHQDGHDTIEWLARQPWCSGQVAMHGVSYLGYTTIAAAVTRPEHLYGALCAQPSSDLFTDRTFDGGCLSGAAGWNAQPNVALDLIEHMPESLRPLVQKERDEWLAAGAAVYDHLPLTDLPYQRLIPQLWAEPLAAWDDPTFFAESAVRAEQIKNLAVPVLHVGGWFDPFIRNNLRQYRLATELAAAAREDQRLVIGPWMHGGFARASAGDTHFPEAAIDLSDLVLSWSDQWLQGRNGPSALQAPVTVYVMGVNRWRAEDAWPLPGTQMVAYYLHSQGAANSTSGDGMLSTATPSTEPPDRYTYDPANPVSYAGVTAGRNDYSAQLSRSDILVYTTPPLDQPIEVTGEIKAVIYAASSAEDTDWTVELHDVEPDGRSFILAEGVIRARYRHSRTEPEPLTPGSTERYEIDVRATSNVFLPGHRIRVLVSSSKFPRYDRNPNAFVNLAGATQRDWQVARQTVYHDEEHPSHILLPIISREGHERWVGNPMPFEEGRQYPAAAEMPASRLEQIR